MRFFVFAIVVFCTVNGFAVAKQQYTVTNEAFENFDGMTETLYHMGQMKLVGRQRLLNGTIGISEDMASDHYKFQIELFSSPQGDDKWKRLPMGVPRTPVCEGMKDMYGKVLQPSFVHGENTNLPFVPEEGLCPFPQGEYFIKNLEFNVDTWPNQIPRGLIKATLTFLKDEVNVGGCSLIMKVEDRV